MKKIICFGTFDGLHKGHLNYFQQAKKLADYLVVVVARDENVLKLKRHQPNFTEKQRLTAVKNSELVDEVILGERKDKMAVIKKIKPNIIALGYDQDESEEKLQKFFPNIKIVRLKPYHPEKYKSSILR
ncbi:MAG: adenylyltransferase/cytidyltransferase family protein [Patescibacteria group bacterium]|jgi:FAD synthetase